MELDFNIKPTLFLDIDGVLTTLKQLHSNPKKWHPVYKCYKFDEGCVKVFNEICETLDPIIILSSDWKNKYSSDEMSEIFKFNNVNWKISDITPNHWGTLFNSLKDLEQCRASEIMEFVRKHNIQNYLAIDDLDLSPWIWNSFIRIPRINEGIKQTGIKEKIIKHFKHENKKY